MSLYLLRAKDRTRFHSFTLVELLVVIAIGAILSVLAVSAFAQVSRSTALTTATQIFVSGLEAARQNAVTRDLSVEFRIYQFPDSSGNYKNYQAFQSFSITSSATNAVTKMTYFPNPVVISSSATASSLVTLGPEAGSSFNQPLPVYQNNYNALVFRFTPKGSTTLDATKSWFATLILQNDPVTTGANNLPANFATIQIDPFSGRAKAYRP